MHLIRTLVMVYGTAQNGYTLTNGSLVVVAPKVMDDRVYYKFYIIWQLCHRARIYRLAFILRRRPA